jgi:hypothetical protein
MGVKSKQNFLPFHPFFFLSFSSYNFDFYSKKIQRNCVFFIFLFFFKQSNGKDENNFVEVVQYDLASDMNKVVL